MNNILIVTVAISAVLVGCQGRPNTTVSININTQDRTLKNLNQNSKFLKEQRIVEKNGNEKINYTINLNNKKKAENYYREKHRRMNQRRVAFQTFGYKKRKPIYQEKNKYKFNPEPNWSNQKENRDLKYNFYKNEDIKLPDSFYVKKELSSQEEEEPLPPPPPPPSSQNNDSLDEDEDRSKNRLIDMLFSIAKEAYMVDNSKDMMLAIYLIRQQKKLTMHDERKLKFISKRLDELIMRNKKPRPYLLPHESIEMLFCMAADAYQNQDMQGFICCLDILKDKELPENYKKRLRFYFNKVGNY